MKDKLKIKLSGGEYLVAEINNHDGKHDEMCVYIIDDKNNICQDICLIRESEEKQGRIECHVWRDAADDDYTDKFEIEKCKEG